MADRYIYQFDRFKLDPAEHLLICDGDPVPITEKVFQVLLVLASNSGHLVEKSSLVTAVWGDAFIEEGNLTVTVSMLRKALGDDRREHKFIETIAKQGYRFLPKVTKVPASDLLSEYRTEVPREHFEDSPAVALLGSSWRRSAGGMSLLVTVVMFAIIAVQVRSHVQASAVGDRDVYSLAVIPFAASRSDPAVPGLGRGIAADLIFKFGKSGRFSVRPINADAEYVQDKVRPTSIETKQKPDLVLTGTVETAQGRAHVTAVLYGADGQTIWAGSYDKPVTQIHQLEDQITTEVAGRTFDEHVQLRRPNSANANSEAHRLYLEGMYFWNKRTEESLHRSIACFQQATVKDPKYAEAYAGLADAYTLLASYGVESPAEAYPKARISALKALQLNGSLAQAHTSLGMIALYYGWDWQEASREFKKAIDLNPRYPEAHTWNSLYFAAMGQTPEALEQAQWAQQLTPLSLTANMDLGAVYYWDKQYDKAILTYRRTIALDPYFARAHSRLGMVLIAQKDYAGAIHEFDESRRLAGSDPYIDGLTGYAEALRGNPNAARKLLAKLTQRSRQGYVPAFSLALLYIGLGDREKAIDWLQRSCLDRSTYMIYAKVDPLLDPVRSDRRFVSLLREMDLEEFRMDNDPPTAASFPVESAEALR